MIEGNESQVIYPRRGIDITTDRSPKRFAWLELLVFGELAFTPVRVVYVQGNDVVDIPLDQVSSIERSKQQLLNQWVLGGILLVFLSWVYSGIMRVLASEVVEGGIPDILSVIPMVFYLTAAILLMYGIFFRKRVLRVRTPGADYAFHARTDLHPIAGALHRARAQREDWQQVA